MLSDISDKNEKSPDRNRGHFYTYEDYPILIECFRRFSFSPFFYQHICILYKARRVPCQTGAAPKQETQLNNNLQSIYTQQIAAKIET
jgi:hypothetical protein